ncbi:hypothetical protein SAMN02745172_02493 [Pseudoxanthobacter soli DSM 19599]|uniref:Uncharacterized protein n=1 Tax=Pseudoxanthobacter soli DSM 19599 TaxID=1123029 RepID=A0A1M7ZMG3_9HYPH|nr:hypothetical protein [Pseudoxanthobacter soli]SHO65846.1 hypothetical protein SAMN02745172_02493 [Pseudoxanthobacter soli DSM 19599]
MSVVSTTRPASVDEIAAEMDRRGAVIERLEAEIAALRDADKVRVRDLARHITRADRAEEALVGAGLAHAITTDAAAQPLDHAAAAAAMRAAVNGRALAVIVAKAAADILAESIALCAPDLVTAYEDAVKAGRDMAEGIARNWHQLEQAQRLADEPEGRA